MSEKPAILRESQFTVEEGFAYRATRTGAIWMNKLFFSCLVLLVVFVLFANIGWVDDGCTPSAGGEGVAAETCRVWESSTATFLGAMSIISFLLSLAFGALGLVVGKRIVEMTPSQEEVGARKGDQAARRAAGEGPNLEE